MSTASRVVKNSVYLYIKMGVTVFISLYTTRLILESLGASDFGIFNIVGGAIAMMGFLNSTMANATQRFMSYSEGEGVLCKKRQVFNVCTVLHIAIALSTMFLLLLFMIPLFNSVLNIEASRIPAAKAVYLCLIINTILTIVNVPYDAVMNAHENMLYYSVIGIFESLLRLAVAVVCVYTSNDKLIVYGILTAIIPLITLSIMKIYCHKHYDECVIAPRRYWDKTLVSKIAIFTGWNFLTAVSSLFTVQGIGLVLNHFFGTVLNASQGIATQLNGYMSTFSKNLMKALNPVIVKNAGANNYVSFNKSTLAGCKYSTYLILLFAVPSIIEMPYILSLWLKEVPQWTSAFCIMQLIQTIIVQLASSASTAVYAQGDIKSYAIWKSIMNIMPVIVVFIAFQAGSNPYWLYIPMIVFWAIGGDIVIISYAQKLCGIKIQDYLKAVILPIVLILLLSFPIGGIPSFFMEQSFTRLVITTITTSLSITVSLWLFGMESTDKKYIEEIVRRYLRLSRKVEIT